MEYPMVSHIIVPVICPFCGTTDTVEVPLEQWNRWKDGAMIQEAFPELDADKRELLKTGICAFCWPKEDECDE